MKDGTAINTHTSVDRRVYIDDSGIPKMGLALYSAVGVPVSMSPLIQDQWRRERDEWLAEHGVPTDYELHSTHFLAGRGRPGGNNPSKVERYRMAQSALEVMGAQAELSITTVYTEDEVNWRVAKQAAYRGLLRSLDRQLAQAGEQAELVVDGDGSEGLYEQAHWEIRPSCIRQPAIEVPAHASDWLQMADLVAYTACQAISRQPAREFMWGWYARYLPKAPPPERC